MDAGPAPGRGEDGRRHAVADSVLRFTAGVVTVLGVGLLDSTTGPELSLSLFYLAPITAVSWLVARMSGVALAVLASVVWMVADAHSAHPDHSIWIQVWNGVSRVSVFVGVALLIGALRRMLDHERGLARTDGLTGAMNATHFREAVDDHLYRLQRYGRPFSLAYCDLDNFKEVNDRGGHSAGDALLRSVVQSLTSSLRTADVVARLGGDEFGVLMPETGEKAALAAISKTIARARLSGLPELSVGVVTLLAPLESVDAVVARADQLMYQAKRAGKGCVRYAVVRSGDVVTPTLAPSPPTAE